MHKRTRNLLVLRLAGLLLIGLALPRCFQGFWFPAVSLARSPLHPRFVLDLIDDILNKATVRGVVSWFGWFGPATLALAVGMLLTAGFTRPWLGILERRLARA